MSIEIEEVNENEKNNSNNDSDNSELILEMKRELEALKKSKEGQGVSGGDAMSLMKELVAGLKEKPDSEKYGGEGAYTQIEDIDPNDYLEKGHSFFCHQVGYIIVDDIRQGMPVQTPFKNVIKFVYQATKRTGTGNETKLHNLSSYTSHSKKEVEWLKKHRAFGSIFFTSHMDALNTDVQKAAKLARIMAVLNTSDVHRIISLGKQNGLEPTQDIHALRLAIANKQADDELEKENEANQIRLKESLIEKDLLTQK